VRLWAAPESSRFAGLSDGMARLALGALGQWLIGLLAVFPCFAIASARCRPTRSRRSSASVDPEAQRPRAGDETRWRGSISNERATLTSVVIIFIMVLIVARPTAPHAGARQQPKRSAASRMRCGGRW
jgi:hypothetical protein